MPNRIVREGFLDSESINQLSDATEVVFHRLLLIADDAGRTDARPDVLLSKLFPSSSKRRPKDIDQRLKECIDAKLVVKYEFRGVPYIQISRWQRTSKTVYSKFPWSDGTYRIEFVSQETRDGVKDFVSTSLSDGVAMGSSSHASAIECQKSWGSNGIKGHNVATYEDGDEYEDDNTSPCPPSSGRGGEGGSFEEFWKAYPRKAGKDAARKAWKKKRPDLITCLEAIKRQQDSDQWQKDGGQFIPHPATWINQARWEDEPSAARHSGTKTEARFPNIIEPMVIDRSQIDEEQFQTFLKEQIPGIHGKVTAQTALDGTIKEYLKCQV